MLILTNNREMKAKFSDEVNKGIALFYELKGITKVELFLSDNAFKLVTEYIEGKLHNFPVNFSKADMADMLLEFMGIIDRTVKSQLKDDQTT